MSKVTLPSPDVGQTVDWEGKGQVTFFAVTPPKDPDSGLAYVGAVGTEVTLAGVGGVSTAGSLGPLFLKRDNTFDLQATAFLFGQGWYYNLGDGDYTLAYSDPVYDCEPISFPFGQYGYPVDTPQHVVKFPIAKGYVTQLVGTFCTPTLNPTGGGDAAPEASTEDAAVEAGGDTGTDASSGDAGGDAGDGATEN
jgi:hypothetical protein